MSIQNQINRISTAKNNIANAIRSKGVTVPANTKIDGYASLISSIEVGGGSGGASVETTTITIQCSKIVIIEYVYVTQLVNGAIITQQYPWRSEYTSPKTITDVVRGSQLSFRIRSSTALTPTVTVTNASVLTSYKVSATSYNYTTFIVQAD